MKTAICITLALLVITMPQVSYAAPQNLQEYLVAIGSFINDVLIPLLFTIGLLFFLYNTVRYFILKSDDASARDQARKQATYGILAFVFLVSIWGIVNLLLSSLNLYDNGPLNSDYIENNSYNTNTYDPSANFLDI